MKARLHNYTKLLAMSLVLFLSACNGRYASLNNTMNQCGFKKVSYSEFHACMNEEIPPPTTDGTDYYSKTNGQIRDQLEMYAERIKNKKMKEKDAYADFTTFVSNKNIEEQKSAQVAGTIIAVGLAGAAVAACANNGGCGSPYNGYSNSYYEGNCPCPYSLDVNGNVCGARSAYSRSGGASPICY